MKYLTIIILLFWTLLSYGQKPTRIIDTVNIYKNKTGIEYKFYISTWFYVYNITHNSYYNFNPKKVNKQDSLVIYSKIAYYFKVYNRRNQLIIEGLRGIEGQELVGDIKFYFKSGKIKRLDHWDYRHPFDTCGNKNIRIPEGSCKYFRKNGSLKKQYDYSIKIYKYQMPFNYCIIRQTSKIKRNGITKSIRQKNFACWTGKI